MAYGDRVREARDRYADKYYGVGAIRIRYEALISAENDPEKKHQLELDRDKAVNDFNTSPAKKAEATARANREIDKALDEMEAKIIPVTFTAEQMTKRIQEVNPFYHFDCSPENLARQKALHEKALKTLRQREIKHYREDPYAEMGRTVWSEDRSEDDYGPYVGMFMGEEDKAELKALTQMAQDGKKQDPEFLRRRRDLHRKINLHAMSIADQKQKEYANLTTEQMMDRYDEILTFCRLGDSTNCIPSNLTPDECAAYHKKMNPFLNTLGIAMNKISALAGPAGDRIDVEQLSVMSKEEINRISGETDIEEPDYLAVDDGTHDIDIDPMTDMEFVNGNLSSAMKDHLAQKYDQFAIRYSGDPLTTSLYAGDFKRDLLYQNTEGKLISEADAFEEMQRWHRPVFVSTGNHPETAPIPAFMDKGVPYTGADAIEAFKNCDLHREEQPPKFEPQTHLSGWQKFKMGFANFLESIPLLNINGDIFRDKDINAYEAEKDAFELNVSRYEERQAARKLQDKADDLTAPGYDEMMQRKLFSAKPELLEKAKENKAAQAEAKRQAKSKKLADDQKALNDWAKEKGLSEDAVDLSFREKLQETGLPLETQKNLLTLHHTLRDERHAQRADLREHLDNNIEISDDRLRNYAADAITCYLAENLLNSEVRKIAENAAKNLDYVPKLSKELSELACVGADGDAQTAMKDKLAAQTAELRENDAMQSTHIDVREIKAMLLGGDKISATKHMIARVNNNAQIPTGNSAPQHQVQHQVQHQAQQQAQNQQLPGGMK